MKDDHLSARNQALLEYLKQRNFASVSQLSKELYVSEITVRRDLKYLESLNLLHRSHGGAVLTNDLRLDVPYYLGMRQHSQEKKRIAQKATSLIIDGSTVFLDSSSSASMMIPYLAERKDISVFTHSLQNALLASEYGINTFCSGGQVKSTTRSCIGSTTERILNDIFVDYVFFSARGVTSDGIVSHQSDEKCRIIQLVMRQSKHSYLLCDTSKADILSTFRLCNIADLSGVVIDHPFPFKIANGILA